MSQPIFARLALLLSASALLLGCPTSAGCPVAAHTDPLVALRAQQSISAPVLGLRAEARVDQRGGPEGRIRGTIMMFLERPDHVRFDVMTQFGPAAILTSDGNEFQLNDLREHRFLSGPTCPSNIARLLGIPMSAADVVKVLMGGVPPFEGERDAISCGDGGYEIVQTASTGEVQKAVMSAANPEATPDDQELRLSMVTRTDASGDEVFRVEYGDYEEASGENGAGPRVSLPRRVHFFDRKNDTDVLVRFRQIDLNIEIPDGAFTQQPPAGSSVEHSGCD